MSLLVLENIVKEYRNQRVLNGVSLRIEKNERVALVGPNGAGKTTLLKIALGLETSDSGTVITARNIKIGYLSQDLKDVESDENTMLTVLMAYEGVEDGILTSTEILGKCNWKKSQDRLNLLASMADMGKLEQIQEVDVRSWTKEKRQKHGIKTNYPDVYKIVKKNRML
jgi:ATPase subunit of ABC transporter with duplicated ATPase domains